MTIGHGVIEYAVRKFADSQKERDVEKDIRKSILRHSRGVWPMPSSTNGLTGSTF